jgi:predicted amidohydrolase YtcJ
MDELTIPFLGERRSGWQYPFGALERAGAYLAAGSDWSVSSADPLDGIHVAVNRRSPGSTEMPALGEAQALSLASAITAYTAGSARVNHQDDSTGRLTEGMLADIAVLDRDPFAGPPAAISEATVTRTYVEGDCVYRRD